VVEGEDVVVVVGVGVVVVGSEVVGVGSEVVGSALDSDRCMERSRMRHSLRRKKKEEEDQWEEWERP